MTKWLAMLAGVALTAPALAAPPVMPNPFNDRLARLSPADRLGALRRAVTSDGGNCGRLDRADYRGPWGNLRMWQVHCTPGGDFGVFLGPDGEIQVRTCDEMRKVAILQCTARR